MKLIIAGSRTLNPGYYFLEELLHHFSLYPDEIVCGEAPGVDTAGKHYAFDDYIKVFSFPADWERHGKSAGPIRNREMAKYGDALLLIWDGKSAGSRNMKHEMQKLGKPIYEVILNEVSYK